MRTKILDLLKSKSEKKYKDFSSKLLPKETKLLGVRIPIIKQLAKELIKNNLATEYLKIELDELIYLEEKMLYSLLVANILLDDNQRILKIKQYVPYIKNWSECDTFCASLKSIKENKKLYYQEFKEYLKTSSEYKIRFFYVISLNYFIEKAFLPQILNHIKTQRYYGFYDKMAVAWFLSIAYIKYPQKIEQYLKTTKLDKFVFQKTISKICDSYQVTKEAKAHIRTIAPK